MKMQTTILAILLFGINSLSGQGSQGYFDFEYDDKTGKIDLIIKPNQLNQDFLYVSSLSAGVGSNDIGLDRGQLGGEKVVFFRKMGNKLLLTQRNLDYRANSNNELERRAVEEAFAQSIIWGFDIKEADGPNIVVDMTPFLIRDAHGVSQRLQQSNQGSYKLENSRSAIWGDGTISFPENTEFEALLTFTGEAKGRYIRSVTPDASSITIRQHHSFIKLPDDNYAPRVFHPYAGYFSTSYYDYATPIESPIEKRFITRHRLQKKNPSAAVSAAVEPIIYYMDPGCPEPIKSALMDGAAWWDQAYQSAGFAPGTFQIKELPAGANMLDVRYNVIQWVHRSTRGWSYGASIVDPRTGEILKGHVSLGSLRVRQDFMIAQGILSPYSEGNDANHSRMKELALARLRQLAAHEVGHTLGLAHNYSASMNSLSSVMDYPHPNITVNSGGEYDLSNAYDNKIGEWDKRSIQYGYAVFDNAKNEKDQLFDLVNKFQKEGYKFISDADARATGGAHPTAHLWDGGADPVTELNRLMQVRRAAMKNFGENSITSGTPLSELEKVLVPLYLMHRYQMEAVSKIVGGLEYEYYVKGDAYKHNVKPVSITAQGRAIQALLNSLAPEELMIPEHILSLIPPPALGYERDRETFSSRTNRTFDALSPAESYADMTIGLLLHPDRLARIYRHQTAHGHAMKLEEFFDQVATHIFSRSSTEAYSAGLEQLVQSIYFQHLIARAVDERGDLFVGAYAMASIETIKSKYLKDNPVHNRLKLMLDQAKADPSKFIKTQYEELPPGSPIGCDLEH